MYSLNFLLLQLIIASSAQNIDILRDYFLFKGVSKIIGLSCGDVESDFKIIRMFSDVGISASIKSVGSNVDINRFFYTEYWKLGVFLDLRCSSSTANVVSILDKTSANYMYDHLHQWFILGRNRRDTIKLLNDSTYSVITDLVFSSPRDDGYDLYDTYNHCKLRGGTLNVTKLGTWKKEVGLKIALLESKLSRRWDFHGMKIKAAGIVLHRPKEQSLIEYLQDENSVIMDNWPKFGYSVLIHVAEMFNITLDMIELSHWEKNDSNGPLMSGLKNGKFDLGFYPSIITNERLNYAHVITQAWPVRTCFLFLTVPALKMDTYIILKPFATNVWYMISLMLMITILVLTVIFKVEKINESCDYGTTILITVAALCQQGLPTFTNQAASRAAFLQIMFFGLLVYNYYSAAIVSSRLNAPLDKMNDSLYSLVKSGMKLAAEHNVFFNVLLRHPSAEVQYFRKHWETIPERERFRPVEEGIKSITKGGFAYHADPTDAYPFIERFFNKEMTCQLTEVHLLRPSTIGIWSNPNDQFLEVAKVGLIRISTAGLRKRQVRRWSTRKPYCNKDKHFVSSVTIYEVGPIIILLIVGSVLSFFIFIVENIVFWLARTRAKNISIKRTINLDKILERNLPIIWRENKTSQKTKIVSFKKMKK